MKEDKFVAKCNFEVGVFVAAKQWLERDNAVRDLLKADASNHAERKKNPKHTWKLYYKKQTHPTG